MRQNQSFSNDNVVMNNSFNNNVEVQKEYYEGVNKNSITMPSTSTTLYAGNFNKTTVNMNNTYESSRHIHQLQSKNKFSIVSGSPAGSGVGSPIGSPSMKI